MTLLDILKIIKEIDTDKLYSDFKSDLCGKISLDNLMLTDDKIIFKLKNDEHKVETSIIVTNNESKLCEEGKPLLKNYPGISMEHYCIKVLSHYGVEYLNKNDVIYVKDPMTLKLGKAIYTGNSKSEITNQLITIHTYHHTAKISDVFIPVDDDSIDNTVVTNELVINKLLKFIRNKKDEFNLIKK